MTKLNYTTIGDGPPLIFVHGLGGTGRWWRRNTLRLREFFKIYLIDLPSTTLRNSKRPLEELTASLPAWLDLLGLEQVHLVGHSMGGYICIHLAATQPERVARLALIDSVGMPINATLGRMLERVVAGTRHASFTFIPTIVFDGLRAGAPTLLRLTGEILEVDARPMLRKIKAPTMVMWGANDTVLPPQMGREMADTIPDAHFLLIPRAGHNAMADQSSLVNQHLAEFLLRRKTLPPVPSEDDVKGEIRHRAVEVL